MAFIFLHFLILLNCNLCLYFNYYFFNVLFIMSTPRNITAAIVISCTAHPNGERRHSNSLNCKVGQSAPPMIFVEYVLTTAMKRTTPHNKSIDVRVRTTCFFILAFLRKFIFVRLFKPYSFYKLYHQSLSYVNHERSSP